MSFKQFRYIRRVGGSSRYCCVPLCRASQRFNSVLSFHAFPTNKESRMKWLRSIRRAITNITPEFRVCGRHFESDDFTKTFSKAGRRILRKGAVPTLFQWNNYSGGDVPTLEDNDSAHMTLQQLEHNYCIVFKPVPTDLALKQAPCKVEELPVYERLCLGRFAASDDDIRHYTRFLSYKHLMAFWRLIEPETNRIRVTRVLPSVVRGPSNETSRSLQRIDEFFLFMVYLSVGLSLSDLAHRFNIHQYMVIKIIRAWASFLHSILGSVHIWMSEEAVKAHLPKEFQDYPDTQVVIDCAELRCEVPSGLPLKSEECSESSYKTYCTFKGLIGMAPHGAVTYVSSLYAGSISDKELLKRSGLFSLLKPGMAIMVDKGFPVDESVPCKVYRPFCFLKKENMIADEVRESEYVSSLRVHVESLIHRVKKHKLFDTVISSSITANIDQLYTVACLLVNYQNGPLVKVEAKD